MRHAEVTLEDKYQLLQGSALVTGVQALIRVMLDQARLDRQAGNKTAGYVSGYRGSPLGGLDQQAERAAKALADHEILFQAGLNEDLAATAVWGSQQVGLFEGARYDGVFGLWYGKAPGVDRTGDVFKHANFAGTAPLGGVIAVAGDDHTCKSSTLPSQSEFAFQDFEMPVLSPADVQEVLDYGLAGIALSRFSGLWVGLIALADTMDSAMTINVSLDRHHFVTPTDFVLPRGGLGIRTKDQPMEKERRLRHYKIPAALAWAKANGIDRTVFRGKHARLGIVCQGQAYKDVIEALAAMGLDLDQARDLGLALYKVGMPWPLEPTAVRAFAADLETVLVIEHKRALIEPQLRAALYDLPERSRPRIIGKRDEKGAPLLSEVGALSVAEIALALFDRLPVGPHMDRASAYLNRVSAAGVAAVTLAADQLRKPFFCSGCPHNRSTRLPEGSRALAGIGCHYMASFSDPNTDMHSQMGGEGLSWLGSAPFTDQSHVFVNLGDGTYNHSGSLAIRAAVAGGANLTYKLLYNDAVAMTGGQRPESGFSVAQITRQLAAEGVARTVIVADEVARYRQIKDLAPGIDIYPRSQLMPVQESLRQTPGVTVLIYDQTCAAEKRRRRKRGLMPKAPRQAMINPLVCEGCGDCSKASNCVSIEPLETEFGRKRRINQSSCNQDLSCLDGFCPSFVTLDGARLKAPPPVPALTADSSPMPQLVPLEGVLNLVFTGIGGTGVTTVASILAMAAHIDGRAASVVDMTGLAQKGGAVFSHVRLGEKPTSVIGGRVAPACTNVLIACDVLAAAGPEALSLYAKDRTQAFANQDLAPTADVIADRDARFDPVATGKKIAAAALSYKACPASSLAEARLGDGIYGNMIMLGYAWQNGVIPVSSRALYRAITLNGVDADKNLQAFEIGRQYAACLISLAQDQGARLETEDLDTLIARRVDDLVAYQDRAYADCFLAQIERVRTAERGLGLADDPLPLTRAAAINLYKLMAYKDEFEVARLYSDGRFAAQLADTFEGGRLQIWLAPPLFAPRGPGGVPTKLAMPAWIVRRAFPLLARLKGLRGTWLDLFGYTDERRQERAAIAQYVQDLDGLLQGLTIKQRSLAVEIASLPQMIRGFGHVKAQSVQKATAARATLWQAWHQTPGSRTRA
jgi:indolepyruvate ferredoxin oxidoreductase